MWGVVTFIFICFLFTVIINIIVNENSPTGHSYVTVVRYIMINPVHADHTMHKLYTQGFCRNLQGTLIVRGCAFFLCGVDLTSYLPLFVLCLV